MEVFQAFKQLGKASMMMKVFLLTKRLLNNITNFIRKTFKKKSPKVNKSILS